MIRLGVIADDFTGATDIASFLVQNGLSTVQLNGIPDSNNVPQNARAIVISLKSRSCEPELAVTQSLEALNWLKQQGCNRFYFKYCSTFDSTAKGNIGPVTDALLAALNETITVVSPALPVNGRTVYQGYLFVNDRLLSESGMQHHPVNPMSDSNLLRLIEQQSTGKAGLINASTLSVGAEATQQRLNLLKEQGVRYAVMDALNEEHLIIQGEALKDMPLVTGGSGLAIGLARQWASGGANTQEAEKRGYPQGARAVILSGSCSTMTHLQVDTYRAQAPAKAIDIQACLEDDSGEYAKTLCNWIDTQGNQGLAPILYATAGTKELHDIQARYGIERSSKSVERLFARVAQEMHQRGVERFIVAGGETSGVVAQTLGVSAFHIGPVISPGVPWVRDTVQPLSLALKSGNFGDENFFARAQTEFPV